MVVQPAVLRQRLGVAWPQLAQGLIHEPPPFRRSRPDEEQILRAEEHSVQHVGQRRVGPGRHAVHRHPPPFFPKKLYLRGELPLTGINMSRDGGVLPLEADELPVPVGTGTSAAGQVYHRLQQVGLALSVLAVDDVAALIQLQRLTPIVAEAVQRQSIDPHTSPCSAFPESTHRPRGGASCPAWYTPRRSP